MSFGNPNPFGGNRNDENMSADERQQMQMIKMARRPLPRRCRRRR